MNEELRQRLALHLCRAQHDGPEYCQPGDMPYWDDEALRVLAEIDAAGYDLVERSERQVTVHVRFPASTVEALWTIADQEGTSVPTIMRQIVTERLAKR